MVKDVAEAIRAIPEEAFRERPDPLRRLTYLERLRWLQQTAYFIWKYKGAARSEEGHLPTGAEPQGGSVVDAVAHHGHHVPALLDPR